MSRRISSIVVGLGVLSIAAGAYAAPAEGPVEKLRDLERASDGVNAKKPKKGADAEDAVEEEEVSEKKSKKSKGKKAKKDVEEADEAEEKPKKKGKKAKKEEVEEEPEPEEPKKKSKGKKGKKEEPPPEEEEVDLKETESPTAAAEEETPEEPLDEEAPAEPAPSEESTESAKSEQSASVSTDDLAGRVFIGLRLGFGIPMGKTTEEDLVQFSNMIPIWGDLGYKFTPNVMVGLYGHYAFAGIKDCFSNAECSADVLRFGVQFQYEFSPEAKFDPWVGLGVGYEIAGGKITVEGVSDEFTFKGFEFANLQVGADYKVDPSFGIGPFVSFSLGRYATAESTSSDPPSGGIVNKSFHEWLVLGVRGAITL